MLAFFLLAAIRQNLQPAAHAPRHIILSLVAAKAQQFCALPANLPAGLKGADYEIENFRGCSSDNPERTRLR
jgi:hypothetical protein